MKTRNQDRAAKAHDKDQDGLFSGSDPEEEEEEQEDPSSQATDDSLTE